MSVIIESPDAGPTPEADDPAEIQGKSPRQLAWGRLRKDKVTLVAGSVAVFGIVVAVLAPILTAFKIIRPGTDNQDLLDSTGMPIGTWTGASSSHWLGIVPANGYDMIARLMLGTTFSLGIALGATIITLVIGAIVGIISGFLGGKVDFVLGRVIDLTLCFPQTLMLIALAPIFENILSTSVHIPAGATTQFVFAVLVLGVFGWPNFARVVRGQVLTLRNREFVEAANSLGATKWRIYVKELLPNLWAPFLVYSSLYMPLYISAEAALAFLNVGVRPPTPTLGNMLNTSLQYVQTDAAFFIEPAALIVIFVLAFNLLGDGLRDAFDPKSGR